MQNVLPYRGEDGAVRESGYTVDFHHCFDFLRPRLLGNPEGLLAMRAWLDALDREHQAAQAYEQAKREASDDLEALGGRLQR
jgi:hypothetical protein